MWRKLLNRVLLAGLIGVSSTQCGFATEVWSVETVHSFKWQVDGAQPVAKLVRDANGVLYGATRAGGRHGGGRVFKLTPPTGTATGWTETPIFEFPGPEATTVTLLAGRAGVLYGTISTIGHRGSVFALQPPPGNAGDWAYQDLADFYGYPEGSVPLVSQVIEDAGGALYGTSLNELFRLAPPLGASTGWTRTTLYTFNTSVAFTPIGGVVMDASGALYGATLHAEAARGAIYKVVPPSGTQTAWTVASVLPLQGGTFGGEPASPLLLDSAGYLYGATSGGGTNHMGIIFQIGPPTAKSDGWSEGVLYNLPASPAGGGERTLAFGPAGSFAITLPRGGNEGAGAILQLKPPSSGRGPMIAISIHSFDTPSLGSTPMAAVLAGPDGALYGSTIGGGATDSGTIFQLTPRGTGNGPWGLSQLYAFSHGNGGTGIVQLAAGPGGAIDGAADTAGGRHFGDIFTIAPGSSGTWQESLAHAFSGGIDGERPGGIAVDPASGAIYGTIGATNATKCAGLACGEVFSILPAKDGRAGGLKTTIHVFGGTGDGVAPGSGLAVDPSGQVFGTALTQAGPAIFRLTPPVTADAAWTETLYYTFTHFQGGALLQPQLTIDHTGALYGVVNSGSYPTTHSFVFKLYPPANGGAPQLHKLFQFGTQRIFGPCVGGVALGADGSLFGATGSDGDVESIYQLLPPRAGQSSWTARTIYPGSNTGTYWVSLPLLADQEGHVYFDSLSTVVELAQSPGSGWNAAPLYSPGNDNRIDTIAIDTTGNIVGAYHDGVQADVFKLTRISPRRAPLTP